MIPIEYKYLKERYNPEGSELRNYQLHLLDAMKVFDKWCKNHDIKYSLAYGTMLGAIRHKGFIPWDDDVDFIMDRDNYTKLCQYMSEHYSELTDNLFLVNGIRPELFYDPGCYIDIFVFDSCPNSRLLRFVKETVIKGLYILIKIKTRQEKNSNFFRKVANAVVSPISLKWLKHQYGNVVPLWFSKKESEKVQVYNEVFGCINIRYNSCDFSDYTNVEFEGCMFPVFSKYDSILTTSYGNYMALPDNIENHGLYKQFSTQK